MPSPRSGFFKPYNSPKRRAAWQRPLAAQPAEASPHSPPNSSPRKIRLTAQFMLRHPAHFIALGFGSGLSPIMPGTLGTLFAWVSFGVINTWFDVASNAWQWALVLLSGYVLGMAVCSKTGHDLGVHDHGGMVWDEIIAFWLVLWLLSPADFSTQCWAFFWFRLFDMSKPPPIGYFDAQLKGAGWFGLKDGFGVMFDDLFAAFYTLLLFAMWRSL